MNEATGAEGQNSAADTSLADSSDAAASSPERENASANSESAETTGAKDERKEDSATAESDQKLFQGNSTLKRQSASEKSTLEGTKASVRSPRPKKQKGSRKEETTSTVGTPQEDSSKDKSMTTGQHKTSSNEKSNSSCSDIEAQDKDGALDELKVPPLKIVLPQALEEKEVTNDIPAPSAANGKQLPYIANSPLTGKCSQRFIILRNHLWSRCDMTQNDGTVDSVYSDYPLIRTKIEFPKSPLCPE